MKWFDAETATLADVPGYWCLGFNPQWSDPQVRVGAYDFLDHGPNNNRFKLVGGPHMELGPTLIAPLPLPSEDN